MGRSVTAHNTTIGRIDLERRVLITIGKVEYNLSDYPNVMILIDGEWVEGWVWTPIPIIRSAYYLKVVLAIEDDCVHFVYALPSVCIPAETFPFMDVNAWKS